ncbi:hypothetical protein PVAND_001295 [Polypedilum vanderplanki]|uniref:C2H2-type domain-containing protein n=1 Tax=Polypedilum vanderplanki TaxID=319348 RepID=A0A9J6BMH7_POLVA|nr:hypothetical protein PVAND_001295 [Polypedilum vanderplanki]
MNKKNKRGKSVGPSTSGLSTSGPSTSGLKTNKTIRSYFPSIDNKRNERNDEPAQHEVPKISTITDTILAPPHNAMPGSIHSSQYEKFPADVRLLVENWKKACYEVDGVICHDASNKQRKCFINGCSYEKSDSYRFCQFHAAVANYMLTFTYGLSCITENCRNKAEWGSKDAICTNCRKGATPPERNDLKKKEQMEEEKIREQARQNMQKVIERRNQIAKENPDKKVIVYLGQTHQGLLKRCVGHGKHPEKSDYVRREIIDTVDDSGKANIYEHESIKFIAKTLGPEYLLNKIPGGGTGFKDVKCDIYALYYTRHPLQEKNKSVDFSMSIEEYRVSLFGPQYVNKYPPRPELPAMPFFWNKMSMYQMIQMLGYDTNENNNKRGYKGVDGYKCKFSGCNQVFATYKLRNDHQRQHIKKCDYCDYVCKSRDMPEHAKKFHSVELAKLKPFPCDEPGCNNCGTKDVPGVYTKVSEYMDWISNNVQ